MSDKEIIKQFLTKLAKEFRAATPKVTGKTAREITVGDVTDTYGEILAPIQVSTLIFGRRPTKAGAVRGTPTLRESILLWIQSRGIVGRPNKAGKIPTSEQLSWAISASIHAHGNKLWQQLQGKNSGIYSNVVTESRMKAFLGTFGKEYVSRVESQIVKQWQFKT